MIELPLPVQSTAAQAHSASEGRVGQSAPWHLCSLQTSHVCNYYRQRRFKCRWGTALTVVASSSRIGCDRMTPGYHPNSSDPTDRWHLNVPSSQYAISHAAVFIVDARHTVIA